MSIESISNQIATIDREINSLERDIQQIETNISRKQKEAAGVTEKISKEKDLKKFASHQKELARKNDEITNFERSKLAKVKSLADKQKRKRDFQINLSKEEQKERDKAIKESKEILTSQQRITQEIERQKRLSLQSMNILKPRHIYTDIPAEDSKLSYDVFISHASEDKDNFVRPFADSLKEKGLNVWYDEFSLKLGDSLREKIDEGLAKSRYGVVVLSEAFFRKEWPQKELNGLFAREIDGKKVILPLWHKVSKDEVKRYSPMLSDMLAINTSSFSIEEIAQQIVDRVNN
jgi:chromosome segregation ATPase